MAKLGDAERANRFNGCAQAGVYETCELHELGAMTRVGWRLVQLIDTERLQWIRRDEAAAPEVTEQHVRSAYGATARPLPVTPPVDVGAILCHEQVPMKRVVALIMLDEESACLKAYKEVARETERAQQAETLAHKREIEAREAREANAKAEADLARKSDVEKGLLEEREASRERMRRLEGDIGTLRREKDRLVNAIGAIKAKEILGEAETK